MCAGKKMHQILTEWDNEGVERFLHKYQSECQLMSDLHHPNIVQFLGLCIFPEYELPILVMERLVMSLDDLLEVPRLPLALRCSLLADVARGLTYLHKRDVIHRDLTAKNVLISAGLVAKISDLGNSRIIDMNACQSLTRCPGTQVYMPPEAVGDNATYDASLDVFSFGHLSLYVFLQVSHFH